MTTYILGECLIHNEFMNGFSQKEIGSAIYKHYTERKYDKVNWKVHFPIIEIAGIYVSPEFVSNDKGLSLHLYGVDLWMYKKKRLITMGSVFMCKPILYEKIYIEKMEKYILSDFDNVLTLIDEDIKNMKLNKLDGVLYASNILHDVEVGCGVDSECCVCLDLTKTVTPCGHKLCVECWSHIKVKGRELPCPMCRVDLRQSEEMGRLLNREAFEGDHGIDGFHDFIPERRDRSLLFDVEYENSGLVIYE